MIVHITSNSSQEITVNSGKRPHRLLERNEDAQKDLENQAGAAATIKTGKTHIKPFLEFCKAPLDSVITRDQLSYNNCANYISARLEFRATSWSSNYSRKSIVYLSHGIYQFRNEAIKGTT